MGSLVIIQGFSLDIQRRRPFQNEWRSGVPAQLTTVAQHLAEVRKHYVELRGTRVNLNSIDKLVVASSRSDWRRVFH
jgi:hypothetical protein